MSSKIPNVTKCCVCVTDLKTAVVLIAVIGILSFGLGPNAGLERSFFNSNSSHLTQVENMLKESGLNESKAHLVENLRYFGGIVFLVDLGFMLSCVVFLVKVFRTMDDTTSKFFMNAAILSAILSYAYGMFFVYVCVSIGAGFPILELIFATGDIIVWAYFVVVIRSYRNLNPH